MLSEKYFEEVNLIIQKVYKTQMDKIKLAAQMIYESIMNSKSAYAFGSNHAGILAEELFYRSGGLALINPIIIPGLTLNTRPITLTTAMERIENFGEAIVDNFKLKEGDTLIIHSVSGINNISVDLAISARRIGVKVIALTNLNYSSVESSRHSSGKRLFEVSDLVLDNCGCHGDAAVEVEGLPQKIAPTSTAIGAIILNGIVASIVELFMKKGIVPPVYLSSNLEGGDEHNKQVIEQYKQYIYYV